MPVQERLMKPGAWDLTLIPETPKLVRDALLLFGHIVIYESPLDPRIVADGDVLAGALYIGILRRRPTTYSMAGVHITAWLGDEEDKGPLLSPSLTANTFSQWITAALGQATKPVIVGAVTAIAGALSWSAVRYSSRQILDYVMQFFGGEYKVHGDKTNLIVLDAGPSANLFNVTPTSVVMPRGGGRGDTLFGIEPSAFDVAIDADSYSTQVVAVGSDGTGTANLTPATTYRDLRGNLVQLTRLVSGGQIAAGQETALATTQLGFFSVRQELTLTSDRYDLPHDVRAGDWIYVYDPQRDLIDTTNEQRYRGELIWPIKLRVHAITWPIEQGMAVYYRTTDGSTITYTDLTPFIEWDGPGTSFEIGAVARTSEGGGAGGGAGLPLDDAGNVRGPLATPAGLDITTGGHLRQINTYGFPSFANLNANVNTVALASGSGDTAGRISFNVAGGGVGAGVKICDVTYGHPFPTDAAATVAGANQNWTPLAIGQTNAGFALYPAAALAAAAGYTVAYHVVGW